MTTTFSGSSELSLSPLYLCPGPNLPISISFMLTSPSRTRPAPDIRDLAFVAVRFAKAIFVTVISNPGSFANAHTYGRRPADNLVVLPKQSACAGCSYGFLGARFLLRRSISLAKTITYEDFPLRGSRRNRGDFVTTSPYWAVTSGSPTGIRLIPNGHVQLIARERDRPGIGRTNRFPHRGLLPFHVWSKMAQQQTFYSTRARCFANFPGRRM